MAKRTVGSNRSFGVGAVFMLVISAFVILAGWGLYSRTNSIDELKPGSAAHPHTFSYAPDGETVWLGTHMGVYEWKDQKWKRTLPALKSNDIMGLKVDPASPERMIVSGHGFVKRTLDGGKTWTASEQGLPNQPKPDNPDAHQLTVNPKDPNHMFTLLAGPANNLFESKDGGGTWAKAGSLPAGITSIAVLAGSPSTLIAASEKGIFRYDIDNGNVKQTELSKEPTFQLLSLADGSIIAMNEGGFIQTKDMKSWESLKVDLQGDMALGMKASYKDSNRLLVVTNGLTVFESKDAGKTWSKK